MHPVSRSFKKIARDLAAFQNPPIEDVIASLRRSIESEHAVLLKMFWLPTIGVRPSGRPVRWYGYRAPLLPVSVSAETERNNHVS